LVPELSLGVLIEYAVSHARQRGRKDKVFGEPRMIPGHGLGDAASDVVARDDRLTQAEFPDEGDDAAGLGCGAVSLGRIDTMFVRTSEPAQIRHHDVDILAQQWHNMAKVGVVSRPAMQQNYGLPGPLTLVGQLEPVARRTQR